MPLFDYKCNECDYKQEHFLMNGSERKIACPNCESEDYERQINSFKMNVEYSNVNDILENKINPSVKDTQAKIGKETLDQDTKTLDNIYGKDKVEKTFHGADD